MLQSEQDSDRYDSQQQFASAGGSITLGSMTGSANVSASQDKLKSDFASVKDQTGLFAGAGGYDVKVKAHTQLGGAAIASQADQENNRLDTGTLGWNDIHNQADFKAEHSGGSFSTGGPVGKSLLTTLAGGMLSGANHGGHAEGTTRSGVGRGTLIVRHRDKQQQDVAQLNRETGQIRAGSISPLFDKETAQSRLKQAQLIGEIDGQAMDVIRTQGDIAGQKAQKNPSARSQARDQLKKAGRPFSETEVRQRAYNTAMAQYGTGSKLQKAAQAVTGALTALAGNNLAGALAGGASPYLATEIKKLTTDPSTGKADAAANALAHAVLGAVTAQLNNQSAAAGGLGAGGGELAAGYIAGQLFPGKTVGQLSESEKQQVGALSQLAAGDTGGVVSAAQTGRNAVENNFFSPESMPQGLADLGSSVTFYAKYAQENNLSQEQVQTDLTRMVQGDLAEGADIVKAILSNTPVSDTVMAVLTAEEARDYALALLSTLPVERALTAGGKAATAFTNQQLIKAAEKISTAKPGKQFTPPRDLNEQVF